MERFAMKTINLCPSKCCPKLIVERTNRKSKFHIVDDDGTKITLEFEIARNLALQIFKEIGKNE